MFTFFLIGLAIFGFFGLMFMGSMNKADEKVQKNAEQILNDTFDGTKETATYKVSGLGGTLKFEQVLEGAEKRGYRLHAQNQDNSNLTTLVFKKAD